MTTEPELTVSLWIIPELASRSDTKVLRAFVLHLCQAITIIRVRVMF